MNVGQKTFSGAKKHLDFIPSWEYIDTEDIRLCPACINFVFGVEAKWAGRASFLKTSLICRAESAHCMSVQVF